MRRLFVASERAPLRLALVGADNRLQGAWQFTAGREVWWAIVSLAAF